MPHDAADPVTGAPIQTTTLSDFGPVLVVAPDPRTADAARVIFTETEPGEPQGYYVSVAGDQLGAFPSYYTAAIYLPKWDVRLSPERAKEWRAEVRARLVPKYAKRELFLT